MKVNAIFEDGVIRFTQALQFKHRKFHLVIDLPESEIDIAATQAVAPGSAVTVDATQRKMIKLSFCKLLKLKISRTKFRN